MQVEGLSTRTGCGGTVGSGDWAFCIDSLAAFDLGTGLDECSIQRSDWPSIDIGRNFV